MTCGMWYVYFDRSRDLYNLYQPSQRQFLAAPIIYLFIIIYYMVYTHVKSFTIVKNRKCGQVTSHCRKARPYRSDLRLFLNVPVVTVKSEISLTKTIPDCR